MDADVLPVDAQATRFAPTIRAWLNAADMPLSLNDPEGFRPSYCRNTAEGSAPTYSATARLGSRMVWPSPMVVLNSSPQKFSSSRNRQTPEKSSGSARVAQRRSKNVRESGTSMRSQSYRASSRSPHFGQAVRTCSTGKVASHRALMHCW